MKKFLVALITISLAANLTACNKLPAKTAADEATGETSEDATSNNEEFVSKFSEYYTDPDTGLEYKLRDTTAKDNYNEYNYVAKHVEYTGPYVNGYVGKSTDYYLKKDSFNENYYNVFENTLWNPSVSSAHCNFFEWLEERDCIRIKQM